MNIMDFYFNIINQFIVWVKTIYWVLRTFKDNLLHCNHSCIFLKSSLSGRHNTFISLPVMNILVSSANNTEKQNSETLAKSLIYNKNNMGPNIEPCGTPQLLFSQDDLWYGPINRKHYFITRFINRNHICYLKITWEDTSLKVSITYMSFICFIMFDFKSSDPAALSLNVPMILYISCSMTGSK